MCECARASLCMCVYFSVGVLVCECVSVPDVVQALLSIVDLEGPVLAAVGAQLGAGTVGLPLDLQM